MLREMTPYRGVIIPPKAVHQCQQKLHANPHSKPLFCISPPSFSSSSRKSSSLHNYYLRKRRKWPLQPYKTQWHQKFAHQLAMQSFKQSIRKSRDHLLSSLIESFSTYEIDISLKAYRFLFKILTQNRTSSSNHQISQILDHIEKAENVKTPECIFIDLIKFYGDNDMLNDAVELFFRIPKFRCEPSVEALNALLSVICSKKRGLNIVPEILLKSQEMNIRIEESSFGILIPALCKIGRVDNAFELLNYLVEEGFTVDQKVCSFMLTSMCKQMNLSGGEIIGFLMNLKRLGFETRKDDLSIVIMYLVKTGKGMDALEVLKQMKMGGIRPDILCYNLVLEGLIFEREFLRADKVFDELLVLGLVPDINTYNVYINCLCMQKKVEDGIKMLGSMEELGCAPELSTYGTILRALCESGELDRAREVVSRMRQKGMHLNSLTYEIMIDGLVSIGDIDGACSLLTEMLENSFVPQQTALDKMFCRLCKCGLHFRAIELLGEVDYKEYYS